jgi:hypothetical protein
VPEPVPEGSAVSHKDFQSFTELPAACRTGQLSSEVLDRALNGLGAPDPENDLAVLEACSIVLSTVCSNPWLRAEFDRIGAHAQQLLQRLF